MKIMLGRWWRWHWYRANY